MADRRVALVSGGSRGIGAAVVRRLAADGFDVAFCHRTESEAARDLEVEVAELGGRSHRAVCDVADRGAVEDFVRGAESTLGTPSAVVTAAGVTRDALIVRAGADDWQTVIDANLTGTYNMCAAAAPMLTEGAIVTVSSVAGLIAQPGQTNYAATKAGIIGMSRVLAVELSRAGVRVNTVAPGFIDTDMTEAMSDAARSAARKRIPLRRFGMATEVADLVNFLVSDKSKYITGQTFTIDGGLTAI